MIKCLFISMPFSPPNRPNLALSRLQAVLRAGGHHCELLHTEIDFAAEIGLDVYAKLAVQYPQELLLGDLVFAPHMNGDQVDENDILQGLTPDFRYALARSRGKRGTPPLPDEQKLDEFRKLLPLLRFKALEFLDRTVEKIEKIGSVHLIGLNCTYNIAPNIALARGVKNALSDTEILLGGSWCEGEPGRILHEEFEVVDYVCRGDGESLIRELADSLDGVGPSIEDIQGLVYRDGSRTVCNGSWARPVEDLDDMPLPKFSEWYDKVLQKPSVLSESELLLPIETSRGCWYGQKAQCTFCGQYLKRDEYRSKSADHILAELRDLSSYGIKRLDACDLVLDHRFFDRLLPEMATLDHPFSIHFEVRPTLTREQVRILKAAGVDSVQPGIESLSTRLLQRMRKGSKAYQNIRLLKWVEEFGMSINWNILFGFPGEEEEEYFGICDLIPLILHLPPPTLGCRPVILTRNSPLFEELKRLGGEDVKPVPAYQRLFDLPGEKIRQLAFFFEAEIVSRESLGRYVIPLRDAVDQWQEEWGRCAFEYHDRNGLVRLTDTRPIARYAESTLSEQESAVYRLCDDGARLGEIARGACLAENEATAILHRFLENRWVVHMDGRFLSLAVKRPSSPRHRT